METVSYTDEPFLTFFTPTYKRPRQLASCLESVSAQTLVREIEHVVLPDHVGLGLVDGMFGRMKIWAPLLRGKYIHAMADDDVLAAPTVVEEVKRIVEEHNDPPVICVTVQKGGLTLPYGSIDPPREGAFDMACLIQRRDVFQEFVGAYHSGRYEGDYDHAITMYKAGVPFLQVPILFLVGQASRGVAEHVCTPSSHDYAFRTGALHVRRTYSCPACYAVVKQSLGGQFTEA